MGMVFALLGSSLLECACCLGLSCFSSIFSASLSNMARFGHFLILFTVFMIAVLAGIYLPDQLNQYQDLTGLHLFDGCDDSYLNNCFYRQMIYRASFTLAVVYAFLLILAGASETINRGLWIPKFFFSIILFGSLFWVDNVVFSYWAELCRIASFFWLLIQSLVLIDFSSDLHDLLMPGAASNDESRTPYIIYLGVSLGALALAITGLVYLFSDYSSCQLGMFFIVLTLVMGIVTSIISITDCVGRGILTPCILFAYSVFMCWYALLSNPIESCNPTAKQTDDASQNISIIIVGCISSVVLLYCVFNGSRILEVLDPEGQGVLTSYSHNRRNKRMDALLTGNRIPVSSEDEEDEAKTEDVQSSSGTVNERVYFQALLLLASCYFAMILTSWGKPDGSVIAGENEEAMAGNESMWLKITSQWIFIIFYFRALFVAYIENEA